MIGHSAEKRHRQSVVRNIQNNQLKGRARKQRIRLHAEAAGGNLKEAQKLLPRYYSLVDRAVKRGALHARTAARYKSRTSSMFNGALNSKSATSSSKSTSQPSTTTTQQQPSSRRATTSSASLTARQKSSATKTSSRPS